MKISLLKAGFVCLLLTGCQATHMAYVHTTTLGIEVTASIETTSGRMVFGYDRDTFALVPRKKDNEDAMSLAAVSCIYTRGLNEVQFRHSISTGSTAKAIAQNEMKLAGIMSDIQGDCLLPQTNTDSTNQNTNNPK